jgi:ribosomal protein L17
MAISAEQLNIILTAKDKAFAAAMDKNAKRIASFAKTANKDLSVVSVGFDKLAGAAAAFITVSAIQQLGVAVRDAANKMGDLKDASEAIGITTDALQELQYAAQLSGVSADVLQGSLQKLTKNLGDAAMGGTAAKQSFDVLGLSGAALAAVPVDQALAMIADKLAAVENPAQRATLATDIFGKSGLAMVNMLADGSAGLNAMAAEAQKMGVVINRDVIYGAAEAADKLDALSMVVSANLTQALISLTPVILAAAQGIATLSAAANDMLFSQVNATNQLKAAADMAKGYGTQVNIVTEAYMAYGNAVRKGTAAEIAAAEQALVSAANTKSASDAKVKAIVTEIGAIGSNNKAMREQIALEGLSAEERIKATAAQLKAADVEKLIALAKQGNITLTQSQIDGINKLATQHEELYISLEMAKIAQTGANKGMSESAIAALKAKDALAIYKGQVAELGLTITEFETISGTIQSSMEDAFMGIVDGTSSAKDAFKSMAADIIKELYRVLVVQRMVGQVATSTSSGSGLLGFIGGAFGISGKAAGGSLQAGQPSVVGEHGRELFVPSSAGRVLSVPQSKAAIGGGSSVTVMQTINVSTGVQQTVRAEIKSLMPQIADSAKVAVLDARKRGGGYGSAFG